MVAANGKICTIYKKISAKRQGNQANKRKSQGHQNTSYRQGDDHSVTVGHPGYQA